MENELLKGFKHRTLALSVAAASTAFAVSPGAFSQEELEEITVTGSRIRQTSGMQTPVPVTALTTDELTNFEPGGTIAEQLDALPQFFGTETAQRGGSAPHGTAGGSFLNMRSLGTNRTLVLLDGSRVVPADKRGSVNVDTLPNALIRTVDVVTGGASAAYGADAMGGVTNFVLDREFEGLTIQAGTGITEVGDSERWNLSIAAGRQFGDRLNVIASLDAKHINAFDRDPESLDNSWYQRWGWVTSPEWAANRTGPQRLTLPWVCSSQHSPYGLIRNTGTELDYMKFTPDGSDITPFVLGDVVSLGGRGSTRSMAGGPECQTANRAFESGNEGFEVVGRSGFLAGQYQFSDSFTGFAQLLVGRSESNRNYNRGDYSLQDLWYATITRDNAYLPDSVAAIMDANGLTEFQVHKLGSFLNTPDIGSNTREHNVHTTYSWSAGFDAILPNGWDVTANWQTGESQRLTQIYEKMRVDRIFLGMDAVRDPATGAIVCRVQLYNPTPAELAASVEGFVSSRSSPEARDSGQGTPLASPIGLDNTIRDCVPYNVMGNDGISQQAVDYTGTLKKALSTIDQDFAEVVLQGEIYEGWGYGPVSMALGATYREQSFTDGALPESVDALGPPLNAPHLGIRGIPPGFTGGSPNLHQFSTVALIDGEYDVNELFGEVNLPIWESASGEQNLQGTMAYRSSDYSSSGRVESWKLGIDFQVINDLRLRFTKSRDVREATFSERFDAQGGGGEVTDPQQGNASFQITSVAGGNPRLRPEIADTNVFGFVYQPSWLEGLQVSTDWYDVKIKDAVDQLGLQTIVDLCASGDQAQCANITRDPITNVIGRVFDYYQNVAQAGVKGVDMEIRYSMEPNFFDSEFESLTVRGLAGYMGSRKNISSAGVEDEYAGSLENPELTAILTTAYSVGPYSFQLQGRHIDSVMINRNWEEGVDVDDNWVASSTWWNGRIGYSSETSTGASWDVALNIQNMFDRKPPIIPRYSTRGGAQSIIPDYDTLGRRYALSVNYSY